MLLEAVLIGVVLFNGFWGYKYLREKKILYNRINKTMEEVTNILQRPDNEKPSTQNDDRLYGVAVGGRSKHYLGKQYDVDELKSLTDEERSNLYKLYQSKLSGEMITSMGSSLFNLYSMALGGTLRTIDLGGYKWCIDDEEKLASDLERDPVVSMVLGEALCEMYYKFGSNFGPIMIAIISLKHIRLTDPDEKYYQDELINGGTSIARGESDGARDDKKGKEPKQSGGGEKTGGI